ncbi:MAG: putative selenate reductase subunit YgfK [Spirochaetaceae bacterium]|nr:MAG: putative selenate reductase subunit YgfK [Spirochaetaceae bacterium]
MRPLPFSQLLNRILDEYEHRQSVFGIESTQFFAKTNRHRATLVGTPCDTVLGPAAGPHTQLAQNIVASYLVGSRFIELKTVQILDSLEIEKPCIDAADEGFNTEWSSELSLDLAWQEYAKAWIVLHLLDVLFGPDRSTPPGFVFSMSVGYTMEGITNPRMDRYLSRMIDSSREPLFSRWLDEARQIARRRGAAVTARIDTISGRICSNVTLSTMHGCPPDEIESICGYMLDEKRLHTYVKLNPTLLGFDTVRSILDRTGYSYVNLSAEGFAHDLSFPQAVGIVGRLKKRAAERGLLFGVKLTNTLGTKNTKGVLPGSDMYMSGRALYPLSITVAARLAEQFDGDLPISFSGGISVHNVAAVFATGIRPITVATDLLKPGGYVRLKQMADILEGGGDSMWQCERIDVSALTRLAGESVEATFVQKEFRGFEAVAVDRPLPLFDCAVAPCITACPIGQPVPDYIRLVGEGRYAEALALIYERNALPAITGNICDHQCQLNCTRLDYEGAVQIREMKRLAVENGSPDFTRFMPPVSEARGVRVAVIGAGPSGLSAAYFLAREGFSVTVFEREESAGGVVAHVVPHFRVPREVLESDISFISGLGVKFEFGCSPGFSVDHLKNSGFAYVGIGIGTYRPKPLPFGSGDPRVYSSIPFLQQFNRDPSKLSLGADVAVVGAGDTAMDTARAALRCPGVERVRIIYRRDRSQMPASREEVESAEADGIEFNLLRNPESFASDGTLSCRVMTLGEPDASGRARPVPTEAVTTYRLDSLIFSIGDDPDLALLNAAGVSLKGPGVPFEHGTDVPGVFIMGDGRTGPSTIVRCIGEGRSVADAICRAEDADWTRAEADLRPNGADLRAAVTRIAAKKGFIVGSASEASTANRARREAARCLECHVVCNKCVEVCPNRANIAVRSGAPGDPYQIVHLDAYCNECGNCAQFCPWQGRPYTDKPTVFSTAEDMEHSKNPGWFLDGATLQYRLPGGQRASLPVSQVAAQLSGVEDAQTARLLRLFLHLYDAQPRLFDHIDHELAQEVAT